MTDDLTFMRRAIALSLECVGGDEGPFGAVVVHNGKIVGEGVNCVVPTGDPTAHAEIVAIREACRALRTHVLDGATIYTSCEPCPMCLGAIWWARIAEIVYANDRADAAAIGFDDDAIYEEVAAPLDRRKLPIRRMSADEALEVFKAWAAKPDKVPY
ncbi:MAG: nucleoside deaminase [Alphaproteobacteria bacterium]|nr:nucleoside deaminase [Alphaproteobacteria bacterium]